MDLHERLLRDLDDLVHIFVATEIPTATLKIIMQMTQYQVVPESVAKRISHHSPKVEEFEFSEEEVDRIMMYKVLHECAEILWGVLPKHIKDKWMQVFPYEGNGSLKGVYFRNLLRIYTERHTHEGKDFFASESFADALAFYWQTAMSNLHRTLNGSLSPTQKRFFAEVMDYTKKQFETHGTAFVRPE